MSKLRTTLSILAAAFLLSAGGASAQEVHFLWSETHERVLAEHNAILYTPTEQPLNYIDWKYNTIDAQRALNEAYPREREVIQALEVVPSDTVLAETDKPEVMTINGRTVELEDF